MDEQRMTGETGDKNAVIDQKLRQFFDGKIVRKDLTKKIKEGANVPVYVLEFLLGQYCSSDDPEVIETGVENVKRILADNYVRPDEAQKIPMRQSSPTLVSRISLFQRTIPQSLTGCSAAVSGALCSSNMSFWKKRKMPLPSTFAS